MTEIAMPGICSILNVGEGDTKISFDPKNEQDVEHAKTVITDMLRRGFAILVQVGTRKGKPLYRRAKGFDPEKAEYIISDVPAEAELEAAPAKPKPANGRRRRGRASTKRVSAATTSAVAVGRTAGG